MEIGPFRTGQRGDLNRTAEDWTYSIGTVQREIGPFGTGQRGYMTYWNRTTGRLDLLEQTAKRLNLLVQDSGEIVHVGTRQLGDWTCIYKRVGRLNLLEQDSVEAPLSHKFLSSARTGLRT